MKKQITTPLVVLLLLVAGLASAQDRFFYSRDTKIAITPSETKVAVMRAPSYTNDAFSSWLDQSGIARAHRTAIADYTNTITVVAKQRRAIGELSSRLRQNTDLRLVTPVYVTEEGQEMILTDEIIVQFRPSVPEARIQSLLTTFNLNTVKTKPSVPNYYVLRVPLNQDALEVANRIQESGLAEWSQPNFVMPLIKPQQLPNDTHFQRQFQLHNTGQAINNNRSGTDDADIDAPEAWELSTGEDIIVAVIDDGFDGPHADIPQSRIVAGYDFGDDDTTVDAGEHGTACAGIVAASRDNNLGIVGVAPDSRIMPIRIFQDNGDAVATSDIADAIDFAWQHGADVLSCSWGFRTSLHNYIPAIDDAIGRAKTLGRNGLGSVVVFAAGNTAWHANGNTGYVAYPGNSDNVVTVGASDRNDTQAQYSPTDDEIDIVAPSHLAYTSQIQNEGFEVWSTDITGQGGYNPDDAGVQLPAGDLDFTGEFGGTSAACPAVAGTAALILSMHPDYPALFVESILMQSADAIDTSASDWVKKYGNGRLNARQALDLADQFVAPRLFINSVSPDTFYAGETYDVQIRGAGFVNASWMQYAFWRRERIYYHVKRVELETLATPYSEVVTFPANIRVNQTQNPPFYQIIGITQVNINITIGPAVKPGRVWLQLSNQNGDFDLYALEIVE